MAVVSSVNEFCCFFKLTLLQHSFNACQPESDTTEHCVLAKTNLQTEMDFWVEHNYGFIHCREHKRAIKIQEVQTKKHNALFRNTNNEGKLLFLTSYY